MGDGLETNGAANQSLPENGTVDLPAPRMESNTSIEEAIAARRSVREYTGEPITIAELSQLLWAAQGITSPEGHRSAPSAGALYPLEVYVAAGSVRELPPGVYRYAPDGHRLTRVREGDFRAELAEAAVGQESVRAAAADIIIAGVYERTTGKYGERGVRYVHMEAGHASENIYLQAESLGLGTVAIGAFDETALQRIMGMAENATPLYVMPVGRR
ncbi:SagB/ThcOx family dehydrogenase [Methanoculleus sp. FWC-SCC1]|uniref:SagB/ThcOx family dehydrogenase n=2 Tax=Methanoculleus frigidifontis TaxID=2584085 RepID=A0ABT8MB66_9EURY|nr:SagB/ThcOx family dehydrogenase [Methanoculleus sp. FWC-SCC1]